MKHRKALIWAAALIPIGLGGYFLFKYFKNPKTAIDSSNPSPGQPKPAPVQSTTPSLFPIKNGSAKNELVQQLQGLLGVTPDGLFGPKTQAALLLKTGKLSISSQDDFNQVISKLQAQGLTNANSARADKLVNDWNNNNNLQMTVIADTPAYEVIQDAYGALTPTGNVLGLPANTTYNRDQHVLLSSTSAGFLKFKRLGPNKPGLYKVDPTKVTVS